MSPEMIHAWQTNNAVNDVLLAHLTPAMLEVQTLGGGFSVAQHLAHMVFVQKSWLWSLSPEAVQPLEDLYDWQTEQFVTDLSLERIVRVWSKTRETLLETARNATGVGNLPHQSPAQMVFHMAIHDAHHRGQILLALKVAGHPLPDDAALWLPLRT